MASPSIATLFAQRVVVGVADLSVSNNPQNTLSTYALGSCVAVVIYDPFSKVGGLLHLMLPNSSVSPAKAKTQPAMFADTGLPLLFRSFVGLRGDLQRSRIFLAGGATIMCASDLFKIGERNIEATRACLNRHGLVVRHNSLGGVINRTVHLNIGTGAITLKMPDASETCSLAA